jgi:ribonuclease VapC
MIVVDSSALLCVLLGEPESERVADCLDNSPRVLIGAPTLVEATIVAEARLGSRGVLNLQSAIRIAGIDVVEFTPEDADVATEAWRRFGRGRHPANLNFGHCMSYATAVTRQAALLFVGDDFDKTDIEVV